MDRLEILGKLINLDMSILELKKQLSIFSWDSEPLIVLKKDNLNNVIEKFLNKKISQEDFVEWANIVECREDIEFEKKYEKKIKETIFYIANPTLTGTDYIKNINLL